MAVTRCDLTTLRGRTIAALNAAPAATWATTLSSADDARRNNTELDNALLAADAQVCLAICETLGHGYRSLFLDNVELTHGAKIPDHIGPIEIIRIEPYDGATLISGVEMDSDDIDTYRVNTLQLYDTVAHDQQGSTLAGYYKVIGGEIRYSGFSAWVQLANFTRTAACQSPAVYEDLVLAIGKTNLVKEGDSAPFLAEAINTAQQGLAAIRSGATLIPPVETAQAA